MGRRLRADGRSPRHPGGGRHPARSPPRSSAMRTNLPAPYVSRAFVVGRGPPRTIFPRIAPVAESSPLASHRSRCRPRPFVLVCRSSSLHCRPAPALGEWGGGWGGGGGGGGGGDATVTVDRRRPLHPSRPRSRQRRTARRPPYGRAHAFSVLRRHRVDAHFDLGPMVRLRRQHVPGHGQAAYASGSWVIAVGYRAAGCASAWVGSTTTTTIAGMWEDGARTFSWPRRRRSSSTCGAA
jgi:hypothetical protein